MTKTPWLGPSSRKSIAPFGRFASTPIEPKSLSASASRLQNIRSERSSQLPQSRTGRAMEKGGISKMAYAPKEAGDVATSIYLAEYNASRRDCRTVSRTNGLTYRHYRAGGLGQQIRSYAPLDVRQPERRLACAKHDEIRMNSFG